MSTDFDQINQQLEDLWNQRRGDPQKYLPLAENLISASININYEFGAIIARMIRGYAFYRMGQELTAFEQLTPLRDQLDQVELGIWHVRFYLTYGSVSQWLNNYEFAIEQYSRALDSAKRLGDIAQIRYAEIVFGTIYDLIGDFDKSIEYSNKALELDNELIDWHLRYIANLNISDSYNKKGQGQEAEKFAKIALEVAETDSTKASGHTNLGVAYTLTGNKNLAVYHLNNAIDLRQKAGNKHQLAETIIDLVDYYISINDPPNAIQNLTTALQIAESINNLFLIAECYKRIYRLYKQQKDWEKALHFHEKLNQIEKKLIDEHTFNRLRTLEISHEMERMRERNILQQQEFARLSKLKDDLLSHVSHDLKNPLGIILGNLYLLRRTLPRNQMMIENQSRYLDTIERQTHQMTHLISDVLDLARYDIAYTPNKTTVDLCEFITQIVIQHQTQAKEKGSCSELVKTDKSSDKIRSNLFMINRKFMDSHITREIFLMNPTKRS